MLILTGIGLKDYASENHCHTSVGAWLWEGERFEVYEEDEFELGEIEGVQFVDNEEKGPHVQLGSHKWHIMGWAKWNRVYYRSTPDSNNGVVMLLVQKVGKGRGDTTWTAVDPVGRVQMIDLRDRWRVSSRPADGVHWTDHPGLSPSRQEEDTMTSERLIAKAQLEKAASSVPKKKKPQAQNKTKSKKGNKTAAVWWFMENMTSAGVSAWTRRTYGGLAASAFLSWRAWRLLGLGEWITWSKDLVDSFYGSFEFVAANYETVKEMTETGELEIIFWVTLAVFVVYFGCWRQRGGEDVSDSESSDGDVNLGTAVSDSDDEPDSTGLLSKLISGQEMMATKVRQLGEELKAQKENGGQSGGASRPLTGPEAEPTPAQLDQFIAKLNEHEGVVERDAAVRSAGEGGVGGPGGERVGGLDVRVGSPDLGGRKGADVNAHIASLEAESRNPREELLNALKQFWNVENMKVGGIKTRVAPVVLSRLYKAGRTAKQEIKEWLRSKELARAPITSEISVLGMILDRMMMTGQHDMMINSQASGVTCLRMYAIWKAYDNVKGVADWQRLKNQSGAKWKSKVDWMLAEQYFQVADGEKIEDAVADDEVTEKLKRKSLFNKLLQGVGQSETAKEE